MFGFGRRKASSGSQPPAPPSDPGTWQPFRKMDDALTVAICLFTEVLEQAGKDCGGLAIRGPVAPNVASLLADSIIYTDKNGPEFVTLGLTPNFKAYSYQPHCRLFLMINAALIVQDLGLSRSQRNILAVSQLPRALVDACLMKRWIKSIGPIGQTMATWNSLRLCIARI
jgi:hypothetical protein